jgi:hypothetical protein
MMTCVSSLGTSRAVALPGDLVAMSRVWGGTLGGSSQQASARAGVYALEAIPVGSFVMEVVGEQTRPRTCGRSSFKQCGPQTPEIHYAFGRSMSSAGTCRQLQMVLPSPLHIQPAVCSCAGELSTDAGGSSDTAQGNSSTLPDMMLHPLPPLGGATAAVPQATPEVTWIDLRRKANIVRQVY